MSRIGNRVLTIPSGINVSINPGLVSISGAKGKLDIPYNKNLIVVEMNENKLKVKRLNELKETKMLHGTVNANINNALIGISQQFKKELVLKGVGYKAKIEGKNLVLTLGYSHPVVLAIPTGITLETPSPAELNVIGYDKQVVGQFCAVIRSYRPPEPYKGKGILFKGEQIIRKVGKKAEK